jgi:hypothetical protein
METENPYDSPKSPNDAFQQDSNKTYRLLMKIGLYMLAIAFVLWFAFFCYHIVITFTFNVLDDGHPERTISELGRNTVLETIIPKTGKITGVLGLGSIIAAISVRIFSRKPASISNIEVQAKR